LHTSFATIEIFAKSRNRLLLASCVGCGGGDGLIERRRPPGTAETVSLIGREVPQQYRLHHHVANLSFSIVIVKRMSLWLFEDSLKYSYKKHLSVVLPTFRKVFETEIHL
jgi:hypothetical protein